MTSFTMEDHLESDWVAVRPHAFEEKEKHKFVFIVAWNEVEGKFAITCHNRTAQRRSFGRDSWVDTSTGTTTTVLVDQKEKTTKWPKSQVDKDKAARSPGKLAIGPAAKCVQTKSPSKSSPSKTPYYVVSPISPDSDVLGALKENSLVADNLSDLEELDSVDKENCSWAGLFSSQDLHAIHLQLCSVNSDLEACLPLFPEEEDLHPPAGMWTLLFGASEVPQVEMDELCYRLHVYLGHALDTCGWKILSQVLFTESDDPDEYYESLSELRQSGYEEAVNRTKKHLSELLEQHRSMESMVELLSVYEAEDQAYGDLLDACTQLYQSSPSSTFEITARAQKGVYERMRTDERKFGKAAWAAAMERMERVRYSVAKETLQLQRAREICLEQRKHTLREEMQRLRSGEDALARLDHMEAQYYGLQLRLYDIQAEILQCEELLLTAQLDSVRRQMTERQDEVVYYDTFECPEAIGGEVDAAEREELRRLQTSARQLEARRGRIGTKRSYLKNKREICVSSHGQVILKSARLRSARRRERGGRGESDQRDPRCLSTSVQTDPGPPGPALTTQPHASSSSSSSQRPLPPPKQICPHMAPLVKVQCIQVSSSSSSSSTTLLLLLLPPPPPPGVSRSSVSSKILPSRSSSSVRRLFRKLSCSSWFSSSRCSAPDSCSSSTRPRSSVSWGGGGGRGGRGGGGDT
ncbi:hypothetical protein CRUP_029915 [Coryphaenoides rupestris]|nr:hypothetical protein CRUP_029915 [Coryphaenoides rupestris]